VFISFKDLRGMAAWGFVLTLLLVLVGFFPLGVLLGIGAIWVTTIWRANA
jgi:uncharacterized membrane protein YqaE (UPF0057 family)